MTSPSPQQVVQDYQRFNEGAGLVEAGPRTQVQLTGQDRARFLQGFCTNNLETLEPGNGCEAFVTNLQGKIISHVTMFCGSESLVLETSGNQAEKLIGHLDRYIIRDDVTLQDQSQVWYQWLIGGQQAAALLDQVCADNVPSNQLEHCETLIESIAVSIRNVPWSRNPCYSVNCLQEDASRIAEILAAAGIQRCLDETAETCRIEAGFPCYGRDLTENNLPQEADRDRQAISFTKGCYLGQETVARIDALGHVNRKLRGLRFASAEIPAVGSELLVDDKSVAQITSSCYSPGYQAALALALVHRGHDEEGTMLTGSAGPATVCTIPFQDPGPTDETNQ